jgi:hypothetical protein
LFEWHGPTENKVSLIKDNEENQLLTTLKSYAIVDNETIERNLSKHVPVDDTTKDEAVINSRHSTCEECKNYEEELSKLMMIITEITSNQEKDHENAIIRTVESDGKIKSLHEENYKMAAEIESLKATVIDLVNDKESIKNILDIKQNEWTRIAEK